MQAPYYQDPSVTIYHGDCREIIPALGRFFDLLLTDPPYGIGADRDMHKKSGEAFGGWKIPKRSYRDTNWDAAPPDPELLRLIRNAAGKQIIWGGNYFQLPPCKGPLVWDKENGTTNFADGEMAWNNLGCPLRIRRHLWNGLLRKGKEEREHPTQKPLEIMQWCIQLAGEDCRTILDPFAGSGTTGRAAKDLGRRAVLIEREELYCEMAARRMAQEVLSLA